MIVYGDQFDGKRADAQSHPTPFNNPLLTSPKSLGKESIYLGGHLGPPLLKVGYAAL